MKKWTILSMALVLTSLQAMAQDDMYFMPSKKQKAEREAARQARQANSSYDRIDYRDYSGSNRNVDEYNRMGSQIETLPADTGDVITFDPVEGVYPDSVGDYQLTKQMTRFDDYVPSIAYWEGYSAGRRDAWGWHSPWYYSSLYPWYDPWYYDPWYYDPWYYNYGWRHYGYWGGYYYHPVVYVGSGGYHYSGTSGNRSRFGNDSYGNTSRVRNYTSSSRFDGARQRAGGGAISRGNGSSTTYGSTRNQGGSTYGSPRNTTNGTPRGTTTTTRRAINNTPVRSTTNSSTYGTSRMNTSTYGGSMSTGSMSTGRSTGSSVGSSRGGGGSAGGGARGGRR